MESVPQDLLKLIFQFVLEGELLLLRFVCKKWANAIQETNPKKAAVHFTNENLLSPLTWLCRQYPR